MPTAREIRDRRARRIPGMAVGLAQREAGERLDRDRMAELVVAAAGVKAQAPAEQQSSKDADGAPLPPDDVLRQLLQETTDSVIHHVTGCWHGSIGVARRRLKVPVPWEGKPRKFSQAAADLAHERWDGWPTKAPPAPITLADLTRLIEARIAGEPERPRATSPMTPADLLLEIRRFHKESGRWPTRHELAEFTGREYEYINSKVRLLEFDRRVNRAEPQALLVPMEEVDASPIEDKTWSREQLDAHLRSIGVDPRPRPMAQSRRIQAHVASLVEGGASTVGVDPAQAQRGAERAALDESYTPPAADPAPAPEAETEQEGEDAVSRKVVDWPSDRDLVAQVKEIKARGGNVTKELTTKYNIKNNGLLWTRIGDARERLGLPRKLAAEAQEAHMEGTQQVAVAEQTGDATFIPSDMPVAMGPQAGIDPYAMMELISDLKAGTAILQGLIVGRDSQLNERDLRISELETRVAEMATLRDQNAELGAALERAKFCIAKLEIEVSGETTLRERIASLEADLESQVRPAVDLRPLLLLGYNGVTRTVVLPADHPGLANGDHYPELVIVGSKARYNVWECMATGAVDHRTVYICGLYHDAQTETRAKGAA